MNADERGWDNECLSVLIGGQFSTPDAGRSLRRGEEKTYQQDERRAADYEHHASWCSLQTHRFTRRRKNPLDNAIRWC